VKITVPSGDSYLTLDDEAVILTMGDEGFFVISVGYLPREDVQQLAGYTLSLCMNDVCISTILAVELYYPTAQFFGLAEGEYLLTISKE
jgi:hypothetical protein